MTSQEPDHAGGGDAGGPGAVRYRNPGPPVDPYAGPDTGPDDGATPEDHAAAEDADGEPEEPARPYNPDSPQERLGQENQSHGDPAEAHLVIGSVHPSALPRTEQERNKEYRRQQDTQSPPKPPPDKVGRYEWQQPPYTLPPDTIRQWVSGPKPRKRRSDWPVLVFTMTVAAVVTIGCCLAGFGLFAHWNPFK